MNTTTSAGGATETTVAAKAEPKSMEEWEKLWATERAAVVKRIKDNKWGISADGKTITGPEGFTVDLSKCAAGWSNTEGITDTSFKVGQSLAQSGTLADYGNYGKSIDVLLAHYGAEGMFKDSTGKTRTAEYIQKDDGYDPARAIPNVDELLDAEKVFAAWTLGTPAAQNGMKETVKYLFQPLTCTGVSFVSKEKVGGDGSASDGWWIFNPGIKDIKDASFNSDPWMIFTKGLLTEEGIDPLSSSSLGAGFGYAWPFLQSVLIAQELDGGLTRANLIVAHRALDMTPPTHLWGIQATLNGNKDSFIIEGGVFAKFDAASQTWKNEGELFDLNGKSQNCAWDQSLSVCK